MNGSNKIKEFYDNKIKQKKNPLEVTCGSNSILLYFRAPYLFVENLLQSKIKMMGKLRLLDLCCGTGDHAVRFAQLGFTVKGIDISSVSIERARILAKKFNVAEKIDYKVQGVKQRLNFSDESFDVVFMSGSLYYLDYEKIIPEIFRVLKKGGVFADIETNGDNFIMNIVRKLKNIFLRHRDTQTMNNLLGFKDIDIITHQLSCCSIQYFDFFVLITYFFLWNDWLAKKWFNFAVKLDQFFLNKPWLRMLCFKFVILSKK